MRAGPVALALLATACGPRPSAVPGPTAHPLRVMSMNQCTDQIVLALLPPDRIASVSWLARDPGGSLMAAAASRVRVNHGLAEEILDQKPDLVIAGSYTTPALRGMLTRLGYPLLTVDQPASIADIRRTTRQIAAAIDERARGEALIAAMDRKLAALAHDPGPPIRVVAWDRSGFAAGPGTLYDIVLRASGARNLIVDRSSIAYRRPDVERLLQVDPALLIEGSVDARGPSLGDAAAGHRVVRRLWGHRTLRIPQAYYGCGTPMIADAALLLRAQLRAAVDRAGPALPMGTRQ